MSLSKKQKSLILFIISTTIVLWFIFSIIFYLLSVSGSKNSKIFDSLFQNKNKQWFNVSQNLTRKDLEGRIVLLDFWSSNCINCLQNIPKIKKLEEKFGDKLLVIGVHSGRLDNEKNPKSVREAVITYDINHPVINDYDLEIWGDFDISSWPTLVLVNPRGKIEYQQKGSIEVEKFSKKITKLVKKYRFILNFEPLPIVLERNNIENHILNFPSKIEHASNFKYKDIEINALIISNSLDNYIIVSTLDGKIIEKIGSKAAGFKDGNFKDATFNYPTGLLYRDDILYVADRGNNAIRKVDFINKKVTTVIGSGVSGDILQNLVDAKGFNLSSPQDLDYFPDENHIIIANLGSNQLLIYDIENQKIKPFAGNGKRNLVNGKYPNNSLAQPSGIDANGDKLYFVDAYSSSLRSVDKSGNVETLIGKGIREFGNKNGSKSEALMQNPGGVFVTNSAIYIADSYNHLVRKYDNDSKNISNYSGNGVKSDDIGDITSYSEVSDLTLVKDNFYIVDSHNNRIIVKNTVNSKTSILDILPKLVLPQDGLLEYLPNLEVIPNQAVKSNENINLLFNLGEGWKINEMAPSFFNLVEIINEKEANLIASYDWNIIKNGILKLPKMSDEKSYYLQGTVYYCENKANALCFIHSYKSKIIPHKDSEVKQISINL